MDQPEPTRYTDDPALDRMLHEVIEQEATHKERPVTDTLTRIIHDRG
jgi:hypothetical protein